MTRPALSRARWAVLEPMLDRALELPPDQRPAFLREACGSDQATRDDLMRMLEAFDRLDRRAELLAAPAAERFASLWEDAGEDASFREALADRFLIEGEAGRGGMGVVHRARDLRCDQTVALKVLRATLGGRGAARFRREIAFASRLKHPHIVSTLDSGEDAGRLWYTMPFIVGETLGARLRRERGLPLGDVVRVLREIADALSYAHTQGVMHRDLKPDNVLLAADRAMISDFGVAKALVVAATGDSGRDEGVTTAGVRVGTPAYMAPEQAVGERTIDHRADLYALGVIAYELIAGVPPFAGVSRQTLMTAHLVATPRALVEQRANLPASLDRLIMRLLAKRAADRPDSAGEVLAELEVVWPIVRGAPYVDAPQ